jgi:hypothetical protein
MNNYVVAAYSIGHSICVTEAKKLDADIETVIGRSIAVETSCRSERQRRIVETLSSYVVR